MILGSVPRPDAGVHLGHRVRGHHLVDASEQTLDLVLGDVIGVEPEPPPEKRRQTTLELDGIVGGGSEAAALADHVVIGSFGDLYGAVCAVQDFCRSPGCFVTRSPPSQR